MEDGRVLAMLAILAVLSVKRVTGSRGVVRQGRGMKERGAGAMSKALRVDPVPDAKKLLLAAGRALYQDNPEYVEGGCGDVVHAIKAFADAVGLTGVEVEAGFATLRRKAEWVFDEDTGEEYKAIPESVWHAWLKVDGEIVDPTWHAVFGKAGAKYTVNMSVLDMLVCETDDAEMIQRHVETIRRILVEDGWDLTSKR